MLQRTLTAIILIAIVAPLIYFGGWYTVAFAVIFVVGGVFEMLKARNIKWPPLIYLVTFIGAITMFGWRFIIYIVENSRVPNFTFDIFQFAASPENVVHINSVFLGFFLACLLIIEATHKIVKINDVFYIFTITFIICIAGQTVIYLRLQDIVLGGSQGLHVLAYVIFCTYCNDTFALFTGKLFGHHKMAPITSPHKTWEGAIGGISITTLLGLVFFTLFPFSVPHISQTQLNVTVAIMSFCLAIGGAWGDLIFSSIKRFYQIKDFGTIFPGHGGFLDRVDSLLFNLIFFISVYAVITGGTLFTS